jgi:hypothetical protein
MLLKSVDFDKASAKRGSCFRDSGSNNWAAAAILPAAATLYVARISVHLLTSASFASDSLESSDFSTAEKANYVSQTCRLALGLAWRRTHLSEQINKCFLVSIIE